MRRATLLIAAGLSAVLLAGCGIDTETAGRSARTSTSATPPGSQTTGTGTPVATPPRTLPTRPAGTVAIAGRGDEFTQSVQGHARTTARVNLTVSGVDEAAAYAALCSGRADIILTSVVPTADAYRSCASNGLRVVDPVQIGSDAVVVTTKNEADVGGDCITVQQARDIFRSGSQYTSFAQLGFDDIPLRTTGREEGSSSFQFFGFEVLGRANATIGDVRSDYRVRTSDARERREVTSAQRLDQAELRVLRYRVALLAGNVDRRRAYVNAAVRRADRIVQAQIAAVNRRNRRLKIQVDAAALVAANARKSRRANRAAARAANAAFDAKIDRSVQRYRRRLLTAADQTGVVGVFRFSYYELFEEQLRPLEIDFGGAETAAGQPVRFGDLTAADQARLAPVILAAQRRLGVTGGPTGPTGAARVDPTAPLTGVTATGLPAKTASGLKIYAGPNCVFPSQVTITNGSYPLTRRLFYVTTKTALRRGEVTRFLRAVLDNVQSLAAPNRLVPITDAQRRTAYITVTGAPPAEEQQTQQAPTTTAPANPTGTGQQTATGQTSLTGPTGAATTTSVGIPGVSNRPVP